MMRLKTYMFENGLYKSLDFAAWGSTYDQGGIIEINRELYSKKAQAFADKIAGLRIDVGERGDLVVPALRQICAEEKFQIRGSDSRKILAELRLLDERPWTNLDDVESIDTTKLKTSRKFLYLSRYEQASPRTLSIVIAPTDEMPRDLTPLLHQTARLVLLATSDQLATARGYYQGELDGVASSNRTVSELLVYRREARLVNLEVDCAFVLDSIRQVLSDETKRRFLESIQSYTYAGSSDDYLIAPGQDRVIKQTNFYVGSRGWKQLATPENLEKVINTMLISVEFGRRKIAKKLYEE